MKGLIKSWKYLSLLSKSNLNDKLFLLLGSQQKALYRKSFLVSLVKIQLMDLLEGRGFTHKDMKDTPKIEGSCC